MSTNTLPDYPLVYAEQPHVKAAIVYNPFDLTDTSMGRLEYAQSKTLADYLDGLPSEVTWTVHYDGKIVEPDQWASITPTPFSLITVVRTPTGGKGAKNVLRIAALIALVVFAPQLAGMVGSLLPGTIMGMTVTAATEMGLAMTIGGLVINALIPPNAGVKTEKEGRTYGADGPKNTAKEGVPVPVVYGEHRLAGNIVDFFTRNVGNTQYLYIRTVLNDGEVEAINGVEINELSAASYNAKEAGSVEVRTRLGKDVEAPNDWFDESIRMNNKQTKVETAWSSFVTEGPVDKVRMDIVFPAGLYYAKDDGRKVEQHVDFTLELRPIQSDGTATGDWRTFPLDTSYTPYVPLGTSEEDEALSTLAAMGLSGAINWNAGASSYSSLHVQDNTSQPKRVTYQSQQLPRGKYEVRVRRAVAAEENTKSFTECYVTDIGDIDLKNVNLNGIANLSLKIKLNDAISGIPTVTALVKGSKVKKYDDDGNVVAEEWSDNPAHIVTDILHNPRRGGAYALSRQIWSSVNDFADFCDENGFKFNGVFDETRTLWDSAQLVAKVGRGTLLPRGTKLSVVIDRAATPEMIFTSSNIIEGTFKKSWLGMSERANEIQYQFYDKSDGFKQKTVRITDPVALARGDQIKPATIDGFGVTDVNQAVKEAEYNARSNSYIRQTIEFDAPLEAVGLNIGDVALIQHESVDFSEGTAGRLEAGSTSTSIKLDRPAMMQIGKAYSLLVVHSAVKRYDINITSKIGDRLSVTGFPESGEQRCVRLLQGSVDVEVERISRAGAVAYITVSDASDLVAGPAALWDTDIIEERDVVLAPGETDTLTVASPFVRAPEQFSNFMFGEKVSLRQPFRLKRIKGGDIERRTLSWVQYDERVYGTGSFGVPQITKPERPVVSHVANLHAVPDASVSPDQERIPVTVTWSAPTTGTYGGADVYSRLYSEDPWEYVQTVQNVTLFQRDYSRETAPSFRVVAFDSRGNRAPIETAPTTSASVNPVDDPIGAPTDVNYSVPYYRTDATAVVTWSANADGKAKSYRVQVATLTDDQYDEMRIGGVIPNVQWVEIGSTADLTMDVPRLDLGFYAVRVRSERGFAVSDWKYLPVQIAAPELPERVTGLRLNMGSPDPLSDVFNGTDAKFIWNDVSGSATGLEGEGQADLNGMDFYWRDYLVRILTTTGELIREESTREAAYTYSLEKNVEDCANVAGLHARRSFKIEVILRGRQGQASAPATMTVHNPAPAVPGLQGVRTTINSIVVDLDKPTDNDAVGTIIWASETTGFTPSDANRVFYNTGPAFFMADPQKTYYIRYAAYDAFGIDTLNVSPQVEGKTTAIGAGWTDTNFWAGNLPEDISERLDLIDGSGPGSVNARLAGIVSDVVTSPEMNQRFDAITATQGARVFYQVATPTAVSTNDLWINPIDNNRIKRWDSTAWVYADDARIASLTATVQSLSDSRITDNQASAIQIGQVRAIALLRNRTFRQGTAPASDANYTLTIGDLWINTADKNKAYRWNGTSWEDSSDTRIGTTEASVTALQSAVSSPTGSVATAINNVTAIANSKNSIFRQTTAPTNPVVGDIWYNTTSGKNLELTRWSGAAWEVTVDPRIEGTIADVSSLKTAVTSPTGSVATSINVVQAQTAAKNRTFYQDTQPVSTGSYALSVGDIWIQTNNSNRMFRWNGSTWQEVSDTRTAANEAKIKQIDESFTTPTGAIATSIKTVETLAASKAKTFFQGSQPVATGIGDIWVNSSSNNRMFRWNGSTWQETTDPRTGTNSSKISDIEYSLTNENGTIAQKITSLETTNSGFNTRITTAQQTADGVGGQWGVSIVNNGIATGFGILSEMRNGVVRSAFRVAVDRFEVWNQAGTVAAAPFYIEGNGVYMQNAFIKNLTADNIAVNSINATRLTLGGVTTESLADFAVTRSVSAYWDSGALPGSVGTGGRVIGIGSNSAEQSVHTLSMTTTGAPVDITASIDWALSGGGQGSSGYTVYLRVYRDGILIRNRAVTNGLGGAGTGLILMTDTPGAGGHTYELRVHHTAGTYQTSYYTSFFSLRETKK